MTKDAKKDQRKAAKEAGKGFKDSFKDTVRSVKSAGKTLVNATGINGKQKKEQAVDKIYGITRGIGTTIAHPIRSVKEITSAIREKAKEKGESYVGGYILGEVTQTAAAAGVAAAAGKGLKGAKAAKKTKPKKKNGLADVGSTGGTSTLAKYGDNFGKMGTYVENPNIRVDWTQYAEHAAERMQQRGMTQEMINDIVKNGKVLSQNNGNKFAYITQEGVAIVSKEGKLITAWSNADFESSMLEIVRRLFGK